MIMYPKVFVFHKFRFFMWIPYLTFVDPITDDVIVTGVLTSKWSSDIKDVRCDLDPVLVANYVR